MQKTKRNKFNIVSAGCDAHIENPLKINPKYFDTASYRGINNPGDGRKNLGFEDNNKIEEKALTDLYSYRNHTCEEGIDENDNNPICNDIAEAAQYYRDKEIDETEEAYVQNVHGGKLLAKIHRRNQLQPARHNDRVRKPAETCAERKLHSTPSPRNMSRSASSYPTSGIIKQTRTI